MTKNTCINEIMVYAPAVYCIILHWYIYAFNHELRSFVP